MSKKEISILDYLQRLVKWRKWIIINFFVVCILTAIISSIIPRWYRSSTTILPPVDETAGLGISSLMNQLPFNANAFGLGGVSDEASRVLAIFNSRTVMEKVIDEFNLKEVYKKKTREETIKELRNRVTIDLNDDGTITFGVMVKTAFFPNGEKIQQAAEKSKEMMEFFLQEMDALNKDLKNEKARRTRKFIEKRYEQNVQDMHDAEEALRSFQEEYGVITMPEQTVATITAAAELKAQIVAKEVELGVLESDMDPSHPKVVRAQRELAELRAKFQEFKNGSINADETGEKSALFVPLDHVPDLGVRYARLFREVELQYKIMEFLLPQYEQAKIQETRDTPTIQILDYPAVPEKKTKPKRAIIVVLAGFLAIVFSIVGAYVTVNMEYLETEEPEKYEKINSLWQDLKLRSWFQKRGQR